MSQEKTAAELPDVVTVADLARALRVSGRTIRRWMASGTLPPPLRLGRSLRWPLSAVRAVLSA